jgi:nicotinamidase-related amidase
MEEPPMPAKNPDLHGNAPDKADVAILLIDVINDLEFPGGDQLLRFAVPMADRIAQLKGRARRAGVPVIYVNDNFGRWRSDFNAQVEHCLKDGVRGRPVAERLRPDEDDYFVLKPKHSGFYSTTLDVLLEYLGATTLVLTGMAANICVLFTANDAYMRDFHLVVPGDCVASNTEEENRHALHEMRKVLKADTRASDELHLEDLGGWR